MANPSLADAINAFNTWTPAQLVQEYGSSAKAAKAVGVSTRTVERWVTTRGTQKAKPSKASQTKVNKAGREAQADKTIGLEFTGEGGGDGVAAINGPAGDEDYEREWSHDFLFSPDEWDEMSDLAAQGDEQGLLDILADKYHVKSLILVEGVINIGEE